MKKVLFAVMVIFNAAIVFAQGSNGLIAHWTFDGNANDVSGHDLNGIVTGATPAAGYNNLANTGYRFDGFSQADSVYDNIEVPYDSLMNVSQFSICVLVKLDSFYPGNCESSSILWRDLEDQPDSYNLMVTDNTADAGCGTYTPTTENFTSELGNMHAAVSEAARAYNSYVALNTWYCVVVTFDGDTQKIYMDGVLKKAVPFHYTMQADTASLRIGAISTIPIDAASAFPYPFYGTMDDIRLYKRPLSATEVNLYCDSSKMSPSPEAVAQLAAIPGIIVTPNPTHDLITIKAQNAEGAGTADLLNSMGQLILEKQLISGSVQFDLSTLPAGLYIIKTEHNGHADFSKLIKE